MLPFKAKRSLISLAIASTSAVAYSVSFAQEVEQKDDETLEPRMEMIMVVGKSTAGLETEISSERIEALQATNIADLFRSEPEINMGDSVQLAQKLYVRDVGEELLNITVDGADQANGVFHHAGRVSVEPELLKRVEIEAGAGSATAGPGALGGAVHFTTKDPSDMLKQDQQIGGLLKYSVSSNGNGVKRSGSIYGESGKLGFLASIVDTSNNFFEDGNGEKIPGSASEQGLAYFKLVSQLSDDQSLMLSYEQVNDEGAFPLKPEHLDSAPTPTDSERTTLTANYRINPANNDWVDFIVTAYTTENNLVRQDDYWYSTEALDGGSPGTLPTDGVVSSTGINLQNTSIVERHSFTYGVNWRDDSSELINTYDEVEDLEQNIPAGTNYGYCAEWNGDNYCYYADHYDAKETGSVLGFYIQDVFEVSDLLTISAGARYDEYDLEGFNGASVKNYGFAPNISANFAFTEDLNFSLGVAKATRGAEVADAYNVPSLNYDETLEIETATNREISLEYTPGSFNFSATAFNTVLQDPLMREQYEDSGYFAPWNDHLTNHPDDFETTGYNLVAGYTAERFVITAKYLSTDTKLGDQDSTRYLHGSRATNIGDTFVLDAQFQVIDDVAVGWVSQFVSDVNGLDSQLVWQHPRSGAIFDYDLSVDKKGYNVHDLYVNYNPSSLEGLNVGLVASNIFDADYRNHASLEDYSDAHEEWADIVGALSPGRDVRLTVSYQF